MIIEIKESNYIIACHLNKAKNFSDLVYKNKRDFYLQKAVMKEIWECLTF